MKKVFVFAAAVASLNAYSEGHSKHWGYKGDTGPEHWSTLDKEYAKCGDGKEQSPVNLKWSKPLSDREISFGYQPAGFGVVDNGHTVQVNFEKGNTVKIGGELYELVQMHFHAKSEHAISSKYYPLEAHFVHKNKDGKLAVLGVLIEKGKSNTFLDKVFSNLPAKKEEDKKAGTEKIDIAAFFPEKKTHYHYMGSLTTPPCSEGVNWNVFNTPVQATAEQIQKFTSLYSDNARPVQELHERKPANY